MEIWDNVALDLRIFHVGRISLTCKTMKDLLWSENRASAAWELSGYRISPAVQKKATTAAVKFWAVSLTFEEFRQFSESKNKLVQVVEAQHPLSACLLHGSQFALVTHHETIHYGYFDQENLFHELYDLTLYPFAQPVWRPAFESDAYTEGRSAIHLIGSEYIVRRAPQLAPTDAAAISIPGLRKSPAETATILKLARPSGSACIDNVEMCANSDGAFPYLAVACSCDSLHLWIWDMRQSKWINEENKPIDFPATYEEVTVSFDGPWLTVWDNAGQTVSMWRLNPITGEFPVDPTACGRLDILLKHAKQHSQRRTEAFLLSTYNETLYIFYCEGRSPTSPNKLLQVPLQGVHAENLEDAMIEAARHGMELASESRELTCLSVSSNLCFAGTWSDLTVIDVMVFRKLGVFDLRDVGTPHIARAIDSTMFLIGTENGLYAVDAKGTKDEQTDCGCGVS